MWNAAEEKVKEVEERISNYLRASGKEPAKITPYHEVDEEKFRAYARIERLNADAFKLHQQLLKADKKREEVSEEFYSDLNAKRITLSEKNFQELANGTVDVDAGKKSIDFEFSVGVMKREELIDSLNDLSVKYFGKGIDSKYLEPDKTPTEPIQSVKVDEQNVQAQTVNIVVGDPSKVKSIVKLPGFKQVYSKDSETRKEASKEDVKAEGKSQNGKESSRPTKRRPKEDDIKSVVAYINEVESSISNDTDADFYRNHFPSQTRDKMASSLAWNKRIGRGPTEAAKYFLNGILQISDPSAPDGQNRVVRAAEIVIKMGSEDGVKYAQKIKDAVLAPSFDSSKTEVADFDSDDTFTEEERETAKNLALWMRQSGIVDDYGLADAQSAALRRRLAKYEQKAKDMGLYEDFANRVAWGPLYSPELKELAVVAGVPEGASPDEVKKKLMAKANELSDKEKQIKSREKELSDLSERAKELEKLGTEGNIAKAQAEELKRINEELSKGRKEYKTALEEKDRELEEYKARVAKLEQYGSETDKKDAQVLGKLGDVNANDVQMAMNRMEYEKLQLERTLFERDKELEEKRKELEEYKGMDEELEETANNLEKARSKEKELREAADEREAGAIEKYSQALNVLKDALADYTGVAPIDGVAPAVRRVLKDARFHDDVLRVFEPYSNAASDNAEIDLMDEEVADLVRQLRGNLTGQLHGDEDDLLCSYLELSERAAGFGPIALSVNVIIKHIDGQIGELDARYNQLKGSPPVVSQPPAQVPEEEMPSGQNIDEKIIEGTNGELSEVEIEEDESKEGQ